MSLHYSNMPLKSTAVNSMKSVEVNYTSIALHLS